MEILQENGIRYYRGDITPGDNIVMVFGSNPEGRHGAGAAKVARERFGAVYGQGEGLQGNAYALPTKDLRVKENRSLRSISPEAITENIKRLYDTARQNPDKTFCIAYRNTDRQSLNGYTGIEMMRMFNAAGQMPDNVVVSKEWADTGLLRRASESEYLAEGNDNILKQYDAYRVIGPGVNLAVDTRMDNIRDWFEIVDDNGERIVRAANYVQELREYESAHFENPVVGPDGSVTLDAIAHVIYPEGEVETSEMAHPVKFSAQELQELVSERKIRESETRKVATDNDIVMDSDGKPLVLWHGSPAEFEEFDFSHTGDNTGLVEYTDRVTGEKVVSDSDKAIFFTDNRELAISYGFLARTQELRHLTGLMTDLISCLRDPLHPFFTDYIKSKKDLIEAAQTLRKENDQELNAFLDRLPDLNGERPISSMDAGSREELRNDLIQIRGRYEGYYNMNRNGGISNRLDNLTRAKDYLQYFAENFDRLCDGDTTVMTVHGEDFNQYNNSFYSPEGNFGITVFISSDRELMVSGYQDAPVLLKTLSPDQRKDILQRIEDDLNACMENYNADLERSGYRKHTHLYPVLLKAKNPLEHDYQESSFPDKYKPNEKYSTAYIAARQVKKALADGNDAVVYRNIRDPFLGDTYGVFSKENIVMLDRSLLPEEQLDSTLGKVSGTVQRYTELINFHDMELRRKENSVSSVQKEPVVSNPGRISVVNVKTFGGPDGFERMSKSNVYIGRRPGGNILGNPFTHIQGKQTLAKFVVGSRQESVDKYAEYFDSNYGKDKAYTAAIDKLVERVRSGEDIVLGCWCKPLACHGDILKEKIENILGFKESVRQGELFEENSFSSSQVQPVFGVSFIEDDSSYYNERTRKNAESADVTIAFAKDFKSQGEISTRNAAGSRYIPIDIPPKDFFRYYDLPDNRRHLDIIARKLEIDLKRMSSREGFSLDALKVNVAGNGLSTLDKHGYTQEEADRFVEDVFRILKDRAVVRVASIRSGGQTGIDEAGIKAAVALDIPATVLAPKGWRFRIEGNRDVYGEQAFKARFLLQPLVQEYLFSSGDERSVEEFCSGLRDGIGYSEEKAQEIFAETEVKRQESLKQTGKRTGHKVDRN